MPIQVSVLICTHNPNPGRLHRVLQALSRQTLPRQSWDLLVVDNASKTPVQLGDVAGRVVVEPNLGIAWARARALREFSSSLAVFVDDDNLLAPDYLQRCLEISQRHPSLGCWGGTSRGEFETSPAPEVIPFLHQLAVYRPERATWSNDDRFPLKNPLPFGAGLCFRRELADYYLEVLARHPQRLQLGRIGGTFSCSCEDTDLVLSGCDIGLGYGVFPQLELVHLIPTRRVHPDYILQLVEGSCFGLVLLKYWRGQWSLFPPLTPLLSLVLQGAEGLLAPWLSFRRQVQLARRRGERKANAYLWRQQQ